MCVLCVHVHTCTYMKFGLCPVLLERHMVILEQSGVEVADAFAGVRPWV